MQMVFVPGHRHVVVGFDDDEPDVRTRVRGRHDQIDALRDATARLLQQELAQPVVLGLEMPHLLEDGATGHIENAARDHLVELAGGMDADDIDHPAETHGGSLCTVAVPLS